MAFHNSLTLAGVIVRKPKLFPSEVCPLLAFRILVKHTRTQQTEEMYLRCIVFQQAAIMLNDWIKGGQWLLVAGRLCWRRFRNKQGSLLVHHYMVVNTFQRLYGPGGANPKNTCRVDIDELAHLRAIAADPFQMSHEKLQEALGKDPAFKDCLADWQLEDEQDSEAIDDEQ